MAFQSELTIKLTFSEVQGMGDVPLKVNQAKTNTQYEGRNNKQS